MKNQGPGVATKVLEQDSESAREFISIAVHDLREPLRGMRLGAQLLTAAGQSEENIERGKRYLLDGVDRIETLIHDIADYCYEEVREHEPSETDLELVLLEAKNELAADLRTIGAVLTHDELPAVMGNPEALGGVFRALIGNACKFRREEPLRIHVGATQQRPELILSVQDNGAGFNQTYSERIFRPFERLNGKQ